MRLHEQVIVLKTQLQEAQDQLKSLQESVSRKIHSVYGDGERSDMVNANTDVLPQLRNILAEMDDALEQVGR